MELKTARLQLRSMCESDLLTFTSLHANPTVMRYLGGVQAAEKAQIEFENILRTEQQSGLIRFAVVLASEQKMIGYCGLKPAGDFVDLSYLVAEEYRGKGIAHEAAVCVRQWGVCDQKITNMEAGGAVENRASIKILSTLEFAHREELLFDGVPSVRFFD